MGAFTGCGGLGIRKSIEFLPKDKPRPALKSELFVKRFHCRISAIGKDPSKSVIASIGDRLYFQSQRDSLSAILRPYSGQRLLNDPLLVEIWVGLTRA